MSARLPFLTLVMKAQSLPDSVILPPTTCRSRETTGLGVRFLFNLVVAVALLKHILGYLPIE